MVLKPIEYRLLRFSEKRPRLIDTVLKVRSVW